MSTLNVYWSRYGSTLSADKLDGADQDTLANNLICWKPGHAPDDWVLVGTAEVHITLLPRAEVISAQVESLRKQQAEIRADAEVKATRIEQQIQQLLCIENSAEVA